MSVSTIDLIKKIIIEVNNKDLASLHDGRDVFKKLINRISGEDIEYEVLIYNEDESEERW